MIRTLLMRLDGPMQSWYEQATAEKSSTAFPSRCALIGMIATARASQWHERCSDLEFFGAAVRADEPGRDLAELYSPGRRRTHRTAASGNPRGRVPRRSFTVDAVFTAALAGTPESIEQAAAALERPLRPVCLGQRCCPPAAPILLGVSDRPLLGALLAVPYQGHRAEPPELSPVAIYTRAFARPEIAPPCEGGACGRDHDWVRSDSVIPAIPRPHSDAVLGRQRGAADSPDGPE